MSDAEFESQPIEALMDQEIDPKRDLVGRVRREIERKTITSQAVTFTWQLPKLVLLELLKAFGEFSDLPIKKNGSGQ